MSAQLPLIHITRPSTLKENAPLLVMLHGYGSDENDLFSFANELPEELFIISIRAPYPLQPSGNAWYAINFDADQNKFSDHDQAILSRDLVVKFIEELKVKFPIDSSNITLIGFSQGSILSYSIALSYPNIVQRVVALSGYLNLDINSNNYQNNDFSKLKIFASHGTVDQVIPVEWARKTDPILKSLGINSTYKEYPIGHGVSPQNFFDLKDWLQGK